MEQWLNELHIMDKVPVKIDTFFGYMVIMDINHIRQKDMKY